MAAFHLELEINSTAHPELHQMLSTIDNSSFRAERLRQLASMGLIWERLRLLPEPLAEAVTEIRGEAEASVPPPHLALVTKPSKHDVFRLPVLRDEVPASQLPRDEATDRLPAPEALPMTEPLKHKDGHAPPEAAPVIHMSGKRSRLMRMKSRGLFTNE